MDNVETTLGQFNRSFLKSVEILKEKGMSMEDILLTRVVLLDIEIEQEVDDYDWQREARILHCDNLKLQLKEIKN